ncbi:hypothetical protein [Flavobacterium taihuense]|uniref:Uncharacterized protein n=1 Tax=Flavobacterium taihuense TaxID=2857508 RepID=A0ABS6XYQ9_9FLAO|nr:hypothetical protein [Flavobacterium taihuense]MBW4361823.1 hypothetical protein [Flavobacterium taihuense]
MDDQINRYKRQYQNALKTIDTLEKIKAEIDFKLKSNPVCSNLHKDLRTVNLDIKITLNEIEHIESHIHQYET